jgi:hypothetical protein
MILNYPVLESLVAFAIVFFIGFLCGKSADQDNIEGGLCTKAHA